MRSLSYQMRVCGSEYPPLVFRQRLGKHFPAAKKNCRRRRFLCGPCRIRWESVGLCIPLSFLGNGSVNTFPLQRRIVGGVVFYAVCVVSVESLWVCVSPLSFLGNGSVNTFPLQRRIVGSVVFYAVRVVLKESKRLLFPRTSCNVIICKSGPNAYCMSIISSLLFALRVCVCVCVHKGNWVS
jgi:hypothetical protein